MILAGFDLTKFSSPLVWFGFAGQAVFMMRFIVQWLASERTGKSTIPIAFWWFSILGGLMVAIYGWLDSDPVILLSQTLGLFIYTRNLILIYRERRAIFPS